MIIKSIGIAILMTLVVAGALNITEVYLRWRDRRRRIQLLRDLDDQLNAKPDDGEWLP